MDETIDGAPSGGRRARKKAATRQALADAALRLFLERGYEHVGVREIAEVADVSVSTLFNYFPQGKEALVFDEDADNEEALIRAVTDRPPGRTIPEALRSHFTGFVTSAHTRDPRFAGLRQLVRQTPALRAYARAMSLRHETALASALADETGRPHDDLLCAAYARFTLDTLAFAGTRPDPVAAIEQACLLLEQGWTASVTRPGPDPA
ncbi:TetR/AcrR family transcriptional regulator [Streptomyces subrutilus]|uniref:TetR family transcriptional regulator n=1 Tax=Streptomyces subrutilus TaxID=36818 RepID=A0A5P2USX1_9ACTN|nr:TetR/AcrR family transcriptional regulator [Streptomyces subrutilus]QEU82442.1 TetR family transcriptional regulator [Streptomyces subrutilus]WSJ28090.1 TetR/AcrR family transcriptional regulator [Streptomyces subrutilus]GGZ70998.1 TetR family transcriptional regulator [Streptomyces subrutilus]